MKFVVFNAQDLYMIILALFAFLFGSGVHGHVSIKSFYKMETRDRGVNGSMVSALSAIECARMCGGNDTCASFTYNNGAKLCEISNKVIAGPGRETYVKNRKGCKLYGNTFEVIRQTVVYGDAKETVFNTTVAACKQKCIDAKYTCKYFEIIPLTATCYLHEDLPPFSEYETSIYFDYYERDCTKWE